MARRRGGMFLGAERGVSVRPRLGDAPCTVSVTNVHYDAEDSSKGPATIDLEIVPYTDGPFSYGVDRDGPSRSICYQLDANVAPYAVDSLVGVGNFSSPIHMAPAPHAYPDNPNLLCMGASLHTLVGPAMPGRFAQTSTFAKISAHYGKIPWDAIGYEWAPLLGMTVPWTYVGIAHGFEPKSVRSVTNAASDDVPMVHFNVPVTNYAFRRTMLPDFVDYDGIASALVGKVNSGTWFGKAAQTVRFESYDLNEDEREPGGARVFTVTANFKWRPISWNYEPRPGRFRVWSQVLDGSSQTPYDTVDFLPLLTYGLV